MHRGGAVHGVTIRDAIGLNQNVVFINGSGLFALILSSKLPQAKAFKRWGTTLGVTLCM